jgi:hypothetical protein
MAAIAFAVICSVTALAYRPHEVVETGLQERSEASPGELANPGTLSAAKGARHPPQPASNGRDGAIARYRQLATCAKYERLRGFARDLKSDPHSFLNYEPARAQLSAEDLLGLEQSLAFVETQARVCEPVAPRTLTSIASIYEAALAAAKAGDLAAARCFTLAPWPTTVEGELPAPRIRELYIANVHEVVDGSVKAGDWTMIEMMVSAHTDLSHDTLRPLAFATDPARAYGYQQLLVRGTSGAERERERRWLEQFGADIAPNVRNAQERWAADTYARYFKGRPFKRSAPACDA